MDPACLANPAAVRGAATAVAAPIVRCSDSARRGSWRRHLPRSARPLSQPSPSMPWQRGAFTKKNEPSTGSEVITDPGHDDNGGVGALLQNIPLVQLPLSTAAGAFDWVICKTQESVQQLPFSGLDIFDLPWHSNGPMPSGAKAPENVRRADADQRRQALQSELRILETMLLATPPPNPAITEEEERLLDCSPPLQTEESTLGDDELLADWIEHTAYKRSSLEETVNLLDVSFSVTQSVAPHCAWPRITLSANPLVTPAAELGPRCVWPRQASKSDAAQLDQLEGSLSTYARCAWPRQGAGSNTKTQVISPVASEVSTSVDVAARCPWPRQAKRASIVADSFSSDGASVAAARCPWPRQAAASSSLHQTMATEDAFSMSVESALSARCAWPRQPAATHSTRDVAASVTFNPSFAGSDALTAPRCAWPRQVKASGSATAAVFRASAPMADVAAIAAAPRCAWPRPAPAKRVTAVAAFTESSPGVVALTPRCAWPRPLAASRTKTEVAAFPSVSFLTDPTAVPAPRCPWPRTVSGSSSSVKVDAALSSGGAPLSSNAAQAAPRCAWPRNQAAKAPVAVSATSLHSVPSSSDESSPVPAAPRCPWPRQGQSQAVSVAEVAVAPAPRCAWPRNSQ